MAERPRYSMDSWDRENVRYIRKISRNLMELDPENGVYEKRHLQKQKRPSIIQRQPLEIPESRKEKPPQLIQKKYSSSPMPPPTPPTLDQYNPSMDLENCYLIDILTVRNESVLTYKKNPCGYSKNSDSLESDIESESSSTSLGLDLEGGTSSSEADDLLLTEEEELQKILKARQGIPGSKFFPSNSSSSSSNNSGVGKSIRDVVKGKGSISSRASSSDRNSSTISEHPPSRSHQSAPASQEPCPFCCNNNNNKPTIVGDTPKAKAKLPHPPPISPSPFHNKEKFFYLGAEEEQVSEAPFSEEKQARLEEYVQNDEERDAGGEEEEIQIPPMEKMPSNYQIRLNPKKFIPSILQPPTHQANKGQSKKFGMNKEGQLMINYKQNWDGLESYVRNLSLKSK